MYILEVLDDIRTDLDDVIRQKTPETLLYSWQEFDDDLIWSNRQLTRFLRTVVTEIGIRNPRLDEHYQLWIDPDYASYPYSPLIEWIESVHIGNRALIKATRADMRKNGWRQEKGRVDYYFEDFDQRALRVWRIPTEMAELDMVVYRQFDEDIRWERIQFEDTLRTTFNELPADYHEALLLGVCALAYRHPDADSFNLRAAEMYEQRFMERVGPPVSMEMRELRRQEANLTRQVEYNDYVMGSRSFSPGRRGY